MPEKVPLKLVFFVDTPLIKTVPGFAGLMLCAETVVMVTTFEVDQRIRKEEVVKVPTVERAMTR